MKRKIKFTAIFAAILIMLPFAGCGKGDKKMNTENTATIVMESGEEIKVTLDPENAPISVENFKDLANDNFYDGVVFHRIEPGFVIQGGDPTGTGMGGPGHQIKGEFSANGVSNTISHKRGVISMARSQDFDSAGSQFFITLDDATFLDTQYAAFGTVDEESMEIVDAIVEKYLKDGKTPTMKTVTIG